MLNYTQMNEQDKIKELEIKLAKYETNGIAKLFYSLNRKANEMADLLNKVNLANLALDDKNDKTFERLKVVWNDAASIATAIKSLENTTGLTNDEEKDTNNPKYRITTSESIANVLGNSAGQNH